MPRIHKSTKSKNSQFAALKIHVRDLKAKKGDVK